MIHPLIHYNKWSLQIAKVWYGILCKNADTVGVNKLWNTMVDFRINVIWTSGKNYTTAAIFFHIFENFLALFLHLKTSHCQLFPCLRSCTANLWFWNIKFLPKHINKLLWENLFTWKGHKWIEETNLSICYFVHVILNILRVRSDDRAVIVVISIWKFIALIWNSRVENKVNFLAYEPANMTMG